MNEINVYNTFYIINSLLSVLIGTALLILLLRALMAPY